MTLKRQINIKKFLTVFVLLLPALGIAGLIHHYAVNVPVTDQYAFVPIFQNLDHGHIPWGTFWAQHNEHRIFFPTLILVSLARLTHWNILAEIYLSFVIACIGFLGIIFLIRRHIASSQFRLAAIFLSGVVFFSPTQQENWLWGWQLEWFLCVASIIWTINLADKLTRKDKPQGLLLPGAFAFIATFSLASGSLAWLGGAIVMLMRKLRVSQIVIWLAAALLSIGLYYFHYQQPNDGLSSGTFLNHIPTLIKYYLAYLGRPISNDSKVAVFAGFYVLAAYAIILTFIIRKQLFQKMSGVVTLGVVGLTAGVLTSIGRFNQGIAGPLSSRYTAFSELLLISLLILAIGILGNVKYKKGHDASFALIFLVILAVPALLYSWFNGINDMRARSQLYSYIYSCSRAPNPTADCLYQIYFPSAKDAKTRLDYLKQRGYGGY